MSPAPTAPILAVAFDLDGLMFDTEALFARVAGDLLADRGKTFTPEIMAQMIGRPWAVAGPALKALAGLSESLDELRDETRRRFLALIDTAVHPTPGLFALLAHLERRGIPRCVATSSGLAYAGRLLTAHGLLDHFAFVLTADDVARGKPDPEIYRKAADRFGVPPENLLVLEDSPAGVAAGVAAGAFVVAVPHDQSPSEHLGAARLQVDRLDAPALLARIDAPIDRTPEDTR